MVIADKMMLKNVIAKSGKMSNNPVIIMSKTDASLLDKIDDSHDTTIGLNSELDL